MALEIAEAALGSPEYTACLALRERILRIPLGLRISENDLALDRESFHVAARDGGRIVGSLSLKPLGPTLVKFRQMAVDADQQGKDIGRKLVQFAERLACSRGFTGVELNARMTAKGFYDRLGYVAEGEEFLESTIPHVKMLKMIKPLG